jgi:hypothetical protein
MHRVDGKMKALSAALEKAGIKVDLEIPELEVPNLEKNNGDAPKES